MDGHNPKRYGVTEIDFPDLSAGIDALEEYHSDPDQRRNICERILRVIEALANDATAQEFRQAVYACMWFGDPVEPVRNAFSALAINSAGWSGAQAQIQKHNAIVSKKASKSASRPRKKDRMRAAIIKAMGSSGNHDTFHIFLQSWIVDRTINGLALVKISSKEYRVTDENGDLGDRTYQRTTLSKMYSE